MPLVLITHYMLRVWKETALLFNLTWIYNDLKGGDEDWLVRNIVIALAFFLYNLGSLKVASGVASHPEEALGIAAYGWTALISAIILSTMQIQDLKDQDGDRARGRQTAPLILGELIARRTIAVFIIFWSLVCSMIWGNWILPSVAGFYVAYRVTWQQGKSNDRQSWKLWCMWTAVLYLLPWLSNVSMFASHPVKKHRADPW
ncbi:hypothetical protein ACLMJK_002764 [Lecanora helva]